MHYKKLCWIITAAVFLSSCELLGLGGDDKPEPEPELRPELIWKVFNEAGPNGPSPVIEDSSVYVAGEYALSKLNLKTGDERWSTELEFNSDIYGKLLRDDRALYVRYEQMVKAYDTSDGQPLWSVMFEDSLDSYIVPRAVSLINQSDTHVFIGTEKKLLVIDKQQGIVEHAITPKLPVETISAKRLNAPVAAGSSNRVYLLTSYREEGSEQVNGRLAAYQTVDGALLWEALVPWPLPDPGRFETRKPTLQMVEASGLLLVLTGPGIVAFEAQTGEQVWQHLFFENRTDVNVSSIFVRRQDYIYAVAAKRLIKLSVSDGTKVWDVSVGAFMVEQIYAEGNRLYFTNSGAFPGDTFIAIADEQTGGLLGSFAPSDRGTIRGFTPAFAVNDTFIIDVGMMSIYGYKLSE